MFAETQKWVRALYRGLLQRNPDAEGLRLWTLAIMNGRAPSDVVRTFVEGEEFHRARAARSMFANKDKKILIAKENLPIGKPYTVIISGVQRGGTSMVAGVLGEIGIDLGPVALNHEDPNFVVMQKGELEAYVKRRNEQAPCWGFKLPGAHIDARFEDIKFRNPIWVFVFRNALSNVDSMLARSPTPSAENLLAGYKRILDYYEGIRRIMMDGVSNYVLVSYERAVAEPERFAKEMAELFRLKHDLATIQRAAKQITGDGGGYLPASRHYHKLDVIPSGAAKERIAGGGTPLARGHYPFRANAGNRQEFVSIQDEDVQRTQDYIVKCVVERKKPVTVVFDFGEGFTGLASYDLPLEAGDMLVRVQHDGAVRRVGFYARGAQLPPQVLVLRCPSKVA